MREFPRQVGIESYAGSPRRIIGTSWLRRRRSIAHEQGDERRQIGEAHHSVAVEVGTVRIARRVVRGIRTRVDLDEDEGLDVQAIDRPVAVQVAEQQLIRDGEVRRLRSQSRPRIEWRDPDADAGRTDEAEVQRSA